MKTCIHKRRGEPAVFKTKGEVESRVIEHREDVSITLSRVAEDLKRRGDQHDESKLHPPESKFLPTALKLGGVPYLSDEYKRIVEEIKPATDHHFKVNPHHPEHHQNGFKDMDMADIVEMAADWAARANKGPTEDFWPNIEKNLDRFSVDTQLRAIIKNTIGKYFVRASTRVST